VREFNGPKHRKWKQNAFAAGTCAKAAVFEAQLETDWIQYREFVYFYNR